MFNFFVSKIEKELKVLCPAGTELELRYRESESFTVSQMIKSYRGTIVLLGFFARLKAKEITVKILKSGISFDTVVNRMGTDKNGNALFYCSMPEKLIKATKKVDHFNIYPNGSAKLLVTTNRGDKSLVMPIFELSDYGVLLVNDTGVEVKIGTKLFQTLITVGSMGAQLVNMQVANLRNQSTPDGPKQMLSCVFSEEPRILNEMLSLARGLASESTPRAKR